MRMARKIPSASVGCLFLLLTAVAAPQEPNGNQLLSLFAEARKNRGVFPDQKRVPPVLDSVQSMSAGLVRDAMPAIVAALSSEDEPVQALAALTCFAIVRRPDGPSFLARDWAAVAALFQSPSTRVNEIAALVLLNAKTRLGPDVMSRILASITQRNRNAVERVPALAVAVGMAPTDPAVIDAVTALMLEPLDAQTKTAVLRAIRSSLTDAMPIRSETIAWLQDSDVQVKLGAISVLERMGRAAVDEARFELQRMVERESESAAVRAAAAKALQTLPR